MFDSKTYERDYFRKARKYGIGFKPDRYKAVNLSDNTDVRFFKSSKELADFLGYNTQYVRKCVREKIALEGYLCEKLDWRTDDSVNICAKDD